MPITFKEKLPIPKDLKEKYPLTSELSKIKKKRDKEIQNIFKGESKRFILIIGPCSADNPKAILDYVTRLSKIQEEVKDKLLLIPRVYTNKPRTTGFGYKGLLHQPNSHKSPNPFKGIIETRKLHIKVIEESGLTSCDELLYPDDWWYISDLLSYVVVGARSTEDQLHRLVASGVDCPVGLKNPTSGDLTIMMNSIMATRANHRFLYRGWDVKTSGNKLAHGVLRGSVNRDGVNIPNYNYEDLKLVSKMYKQYKLNYPSLIVDTNHSNSGKKHKEQIRIAKEVMHSRKIDKEIQHMVKGLLIESYIEGGKQNLDKGIYGKSITDPCLSWKDSEKLIKSIAELV